MDKDIWGRESMKLYEKVGKEICRSSSNPLLSEEGQMIQDLFVLFYKGKPDIRGTGELLYEGEWINYGSKLYRVNTLLTLNELKELVIKELNVREKDFLVSGVKVDPRILWKYMFSKLFNLSKRIRKKENKWRLKIFKRRIYHD